MEKFNPPLSNEKNKMLSLIRKKERRLADYGRLGMMGVLFVAAMWALLWLSRPAAPLQAQTAAWQATYWNNRYLTGEPVLQRQEESLNHNWGDGSPHPLIRDDNFSARWVRQLALPAGHYRFTATTDDGMRVWVNNTLVIDTWQDSQVHSLSGDIFLWTPEQQVKVEYYEAGGGAIARLDYTLLSGFEGEWLGRYFNNMNLSGEPAAVRYNPQINFGWVGSPVEGVNPDHFSASWSRDLLLDPGRYRFSVTADDGARLWVNGRLVIAAWQDQPATTYSVNVDIPGGQTPVRLEYYENEGEAVIQLAWTAITVFPSPTPPPESPYWRGEYFNNITLDSTPVLVRDETQIDFDWGLGSPAARTLTGNRFSARWTRTLNLPPGRYQFTTTTDDGARLWLNGELRIDAWQVQPVTSHSTILDHPGGPLPVTMTYFENTGLAEAHLAWQQLPAASPTAVPGSPTATMTGANALNVRSGPGLEFEPFTSLSYGQTVPLVGRDRWGIWLKIMLPNGEMGWVSSRYLTSDTPYATLPVVSSQPGNG